MFQINGKILHFKNPKVQGNFNSNTIAVSGNHVEKELTEMLPDILPKLGKEGIEAPKREVGANPATENSQGHRHRRLCYH